MECAISRAEEDTFLREACATKTSSSPSQIRILAHAAIQFYHVRNGVWESVVGGVVGLIAFGKGVENLHLVVLSATEQKLIFDQNVSTVTSYTVRFFFV